jgi:hypothetical protein
MSEYATEEILIKFESPNSCFFFKKVFGLFFSIKNNI